MIAAERLRWPFLLLALVSLAAAVLLEMGSTFFLTQNVGGAAASTHRQMGIPSLWLIDISLLWNAVLFSLPLLISKNFVARSQGLVSLILSIVIVIVGIVTAIEAFVLLLVMLALVVSFFGMIVYLAIWGRFDTDSAAVVLGAITFFKLAFVGLLILAQQRFLQSKGLIILIAISLVCDLLLNILYNLVPGIFVSIVDSLGALIIAIVAIIYAIFQAIWAVVAIVRAIV